MQCLMFTCLALQIDTKNILFICGGAFVDLEKTISERLWTLDSLCVLCFGLVISQAFNNQGLPCFFFLGDMILQLVSERRFVQICDLVVL